MAAARVRKKFYQVHLPGLQAHLPAMRSKQSLIVTRGAGLTPGVYKKSNRPEPNERSDNGKHQGDRIGYRCVRHVMGNAYDDHDILKGIPPCSLKKPNFKIRHLS